MKHALKITLILLAIFLLTQVFGLYTVNKYLNVEINETGSYISYPDTALGQAPEIHEKSYTFIYILIAVLIGTALLLLLVRLKVGKFWKYWYFLSVWITMTISFGVYMISLIALLLAFVLAIFKVHKKNFYVQNITEIFIYTGIVVLFIPIINLVSATLLLIFISIYDYIAVFKSKHMIKLAKFQSEQKVFAGLQIPYSTDSGEIVTQKSSSKKVGKKIQVKSALLGGGDIAFPLIFSTAAMVFFIENLGLSKINAMLYSFIISIVTAIFLFGLFYYGKKDKFYPAMPAVTLGCFIGLGIAYLMLVFS